jgi:aspartate aminotransferase
MTDRAIGIARRWRDIISLSVGEPDFATPPHVIAAAKAALDAGDTNTPRSAARPPEKAAALHFKRDLGIDVPPAQVIVSAGGKQAIFHALLATLDPGDEVLIPAPWWVSYPEIVRFAGAAVVPLETTLLAAFRITPQQLEAAITPHPLAAAQQSRQSHRRGLFGRPAGRASAKCWRRHPACW